MPDASFLGWPFFEERHRALAAALEAWCADNLPVEHDDVDAVCERLVTKLGRDGWLIHSAIDPDAAGAGPKPDGSAGAGASTGAGVLDVRTLCLMREILARHDALADFAFAMQGLGAGAISLFGSAAQRAWLKRTRAGTAIAAFALSERKSGSDVASMEMSAAPDRGDYILNGEKTWISNGGIADFYVVFARTGEAPGAKGISAFVVPAGIVGFSLVERIDLMAPHPLARIRFENARVPAAAMIGAPGEGFKIAMATLDIFRATVGAAALGLARRAFDEAVLRARERRLFGAPLADLQMTQAAIAEMAVDIDAAALLVYRAAWAKDAGAPRVTREAAMAKLFATERAQRVIDKAVQIFGGDGVRRGAVVEKLYREIRALRIYEGASEVQKVIIARQALGG